MKYFEALTEECEIKARYKELAKAHHPDKGGRDNENNGTKKANT